MMMSVQPSVLDELLPSLVQYLNLTHMRRFLKQAGQLTDDEFEQLEVAHSNPTGQAIEKLVIMMKRKGPDHEHAFLKALKNSMQVNDAHRGHEVIIPMIEQKLSERSCYHGNPHNRSSPDVHYNNYGPNGHLDDSGINNDSISTDTSSLGRSLWSSPWPSPNRSYQEHLTDDSRIDGPCLQPRKLLSGEPLELAKFELIDSSRKARHEVDTLRIKVARDSAEIATTFTKLVLDVYRLLQSLSTPLEEVRLAIMFMGCGRDLLLRMFDDSSDIACASTLIVLIQSLRNYSSWYNYRLIKFVAEEFGGTEGKKLIANYEEILRRYFETVIIYQCPQFSLPGGIPRGYEKLEVKLDWDFRTCRMQDVVLFQAKLSELLGLNPEVFLLRSIEEGCVLITWDVPACAASYIVTKVFSHASELSQEPVIHVHILNKCIDFTTLKVEPVPKPMVCLQSSHKEHTQRSLSASQSIASTGSGQSAVSELTSVNSKRSSQADEDATGRRSQLIDIAESADEEAILRAYSSSSSLAVSRQSGICLSDEFGNVTVTTPPHSAEIPRDTKMNCGSLHLLPHHPYFSEVNLIELDSSSAYEKHRNRAMSEDILQGNSRGHQVTTRTSRTRRKYSSFFRSPFKHLLRPFRRQSRSNTPRVPTSPDKRSTSSSVHFPILSLSVEPSSNGLHYYYIEGNGSDASPQDYQEQSGNIPLVYISSNTPDVIQQSSLGFSSNWESEYSSGNSVLTLPISTAGTSSRSGSPYSPSSGYLGSSSMITSIAVSPAHSTTSQEFETDLSCSVPSDSPEQFSRPRTNSAPYKLHSVLRQPSITRDTDNIFRKLPKRNHSSAASDHRSFSPMASVQIYHGTSDYFSDTSGILTPQSPSQYDSQSVLDASLVMTPTMECRPEFSSRIPERRHSTNSRFRSRIQPRGISMYGAPTTQ